MSVKKLLLLNCLVWLVVPAVYAKRQPLANEGIDGLYVRSMEQVLRLDERATGHDG